MSFLTNILGRRSHPPTSEHDREEQGYLPEQDTNRSPSGTLNGNTSHLQQPLPVHGAGNPITQRIPMSRTFTLTRTNADALIPTADKLLIFRALTGVDTVPLVSNLGHDTPRSAPNVGIFSRIVKAEMLAKRNYKLFSLVLNICLGIQIIAAAIITALGAARGSYNSITAFGAINTVVAAVQTYLKGSGMPNNFKHQENEWKMIREHIEQREREFCLADCGLDVYEEVTLVEEMYRRTKADLESNATPGAASSASAQAAPAPIDRRSVAGLSVPDKFGKGGAGVSAQVKEGLGEMREMRDNVKEGLGKISSFGSSMGWGSGDHKKESGVVGLWHHHGETKEEDGQMRRSGTMAEAEKAEDHEKGKGHQCESCGRP